MRIDATTLAVDGLRYASPAQSGGENEAGGDNEVVLGKSGGVTGFYETTSAGHAVDATAGHFDVRRVGWNIGKAKLAVEEVARLATLALHLEIPSGDAKMQLRLGLESARLPKLRYTSESFELTASVELTGALVERDAAGKLSVVAVGAQLREVVVKAGAVELHVGQIVARRFALVSDASMRVSAEGIELLDVRVVAGDLILHATKLDVPNGLSFQDGRIEVAEATLSSLDVTCDLPPAAPPDASAEKSASQPATKLPDIAALDKLDGHVSADLHIHATLPLLKERGATHALRIPIQQGAVSFGGLEDDFSAVADALLDFEVEGDTLKLELDVIPIVRFDNITLLSWKLVDPIDRQLAADKSIRLRRLMQFDRPSSNEDKPAKRHDKGSIRLLGVDVATIAVQLSARTPVTLPIGGGTICLDGGDGNTAPSFELGGELHVAVEGESKPGQLHASAKSVAGAITEVGLGSIEVTAATFAIPSVDSVHVAFDGTRPTRLIGSVPAFRLKGATVRLGEPKAP